MKMKPKQIAWRSIWRHLGISGSYRIHFRDLSRRGESTCHIGRERFIAANGKFYFRNWNIPGSNWICFTIKKRYNKPMLPLLKGNLTCKNSLRMGTLFHLWSLPGQSVSWHPVNFRSSRQSQPLSAIMSPEPQKRRRSWNWTGELKSSDRYSFNL